MGHSPSGDGSSGEGRPPTVSELADRIKTLKAAHGAATAAREATPERTAPQQVRGEEPVTARIRRRAEAMPATEPAMEPEASASPPATSPLSESAAPALPAPLTPDLPAPPETTHQHRAAISRRRKERQLIMF